MGKEKRGKEKEDGKKRKKEGGKNEREKGRKRRKGHPQIFYLDLHLCKHPHIAGFLRERGKKQEA